MSVPNPLESEVERAGHLAESIREGVENLRVPHSQSKAAPFVTISCGVTSTLPGRQSPGILISTADEALYEAKGRGRNRVTAQECA